MVICCDGFWDVLNSGEVVHFIKSRLGPREFLQTRIQAGHLKFWRFLEELLDRCLSPDLRQTHGVGGDNMTALLVFFLPAAEAAIAYR